ncbi:hypothetical protein H2201_001693 [Coniosporium apollinis]|uniref:F-box domain-containing protein n=1 Tax=Coniosporium apollinis TaxID=61459 RepID=A0ABQ9P1Z0_9PEZI|nr:hypothetical protein H2201_001693 [Coniosporium apollinis]
MTPQATIQRRKTVADSDSTAIAEVLNTVELLENILLHVNPERTVFVLQRVSAMWQNVITHSIKIKRMLFLVPVGDYATDFIGLARSEGDGFFPIPTRSRLQRYGIVLSNGVTFGDLFDRLEDLVHKMWTGSQGLSPLPRAENFLLPMTWCILEAKPEHEADTVLDRITEENSDTWTFDDKYGLEYMRWPANTDICPPRS